MKYQNPSTSGFNNLNYFVKFIDKLSRRTFKKKFKSKAKNEAGGEQQSIEAMQAALLTTSQLSKQANNLSQVSCDLAGLEKKILAAVQNIKNNVDKANTNPNQPKSVVEGQKKAKALTDQLNSVCNDFDDLLEEIKCEGNFMEKFFTILLK